LIDIIVVFTAAAFMVAVVGNSAADTTVVTNIMTGLTQ